MHPTRSESPLGNEQRSDWRRHGPYWGMLVGGIGLPFSLYFIAAVLMGDTGGPLIWPLVSMVFGFVGLVVGYAARADWRSEADTPLVSSSTVNRDSKPASIRWLALALIIVGAGLLLDASRMPRLRNVEAYEMHYSRLGLQEGDTAEFRKLRERFLTDKTVSEDYGATLMICGIALLVISSWWRRRRTWLSERWQRFLWGIAAALASVSSEVGSLFLAAVRGELPWWADSIAIPLRGLPVVFVLMVGWVLGHSLLGGRNADRVRNSTFRLVAIWLRLQFAITTGLVVWAVLEGDFLMIAPRVLWLVFYDVVLRSHNRTGRIVEF